MVEVALSLAIVGIGIGGIMALFPVALNANKEAIGDNYCPDIASQFLGYIQMMCILDADWSNAASYVQKIPTGKPYDGSEKNDSYWKTTPENNTNIYTPDSIPAPPAPDHGMFRIVQMNGDIVDFDAEVRVWKTQIEHLFVSSTHPDVQVPWTHGINLSVEISWPRAKPYNSRYVRNYSLEIFNPNQ